MPATGVGRCWVLAWYIQLPAYELVPVTNSGVVWFTLYQFIVRLPLELVPGIGAWCGVIVLIRWCASVGELLYRSDLAGVLLLVGLQRQSKRTLVPGVPAEAVVVIAALVECNAQVSGVQKVISVSARCVPPPDPELGCGSNVNE